MTQDKDPKSTDVGEPTRNPADEGDLASPGDTSSQESSDSGESGGGPYPNPHTSKEEGGFDGGQTDAGYHGHGQLGSEHVGTNDNAPARDD